MASSHSLREEEPGSTYVDIEECSMEIGEISDTGRFSESDQTLHSCADIGAKFQELGDVCKDLQFVPTPPQPTSTMRWQSTSPVVWTRHVATMNLISALNQIDQTANAPRLAQDLASTCDVFLCNDFCRFSRWVLDVFNSMAMLNQISMGLMMYPDILQNIELNFSPAMTKVEWSLYKIVVAVLPTVPSASFNSHYEMAIALSGVCLHCIRSLVETPEFESLGCHIQACPLGAETVLPHIKPMALGAIRCIRENLEYLWEVLREAVLHCDCAWKFFSRTVSIYFQIVKMVASFCRKVLQVVDRGYQSLDACSPNELPTLDLEMSSSISNDSPQKKPTWRVSKTVDVQIVPPVSPAKIISLPRQESDRPVEVVYASNHFRGFQFLSNLMKTRTPVSRVAEAEPTNEMLMLANSRSLEWDESSDCVMSSPEPQRTLRKRKPSHSTPSTEKRKRPDAIDNKINSPGSSLMRARRGYTKWTDDEVERLIAGYNENPNAWNTIGRNYHLIGRTDVDLKDKWRNLCSHGHVGIRQSDGQYYRWKRGTHPFAEICKL